MKLYHFITMDYNEYKIYKSYGICSPKALYDIDKDLFMKTSYSIYKERAARYINKNVKDVTGEDILNFLDNSLPRKNKQLNSSSIFFTFTPFKFLPKFIRQSLAPCIQLTIDTNNLYLYKPILVYHSGKEMSWSEIESSKFSDWINEKTIKIDKERKTKLFVDVPHLAVNAYRIPYDQIEKYEIIKRSMIDDNINDNINIEIKNITYDSCGLPGMSPICNELLKDRCSGKYITNEQKEIIGYIWIKQNEYNHFEISFFEINEKFRKKGYGRLLLNLYKSAQVLYVEESNMIARSLYEKCGWKYSGIIDHFSKKNKNKNKKWLLYYNPKTITIDQLNVYRKEYMNKL